MSYTESVLWEKFVQNSIDFPKLKEVYENTRNQAEVLTGEIRAILPDYTVHDVKHLDALWNVADQVIGDEISLNPLEIFVLGCSFLFHDSGMSFASYPGGLGEIEATPAWKRLLARKSMKATPTNKNGRRALLEIFLREQHAMRALELPYVGWEAKDTTYFLMENATYRANFGEVIGEISASHWWPHDKVEETFTSSFNAPSGFPAEWSIDKLKLACILRCADAANIDQSRAPGFLYALQHGSINELSDQHWDFQSRMLPAQRRGDALVYGCNRRYSRDEAAIWWLAHDTMTMVDSELRACDRLLSRQGSAHQRLAARRVTDIDSPILMTEQITVSGWQPVDTAFTISDIPKLIEKLGGSKLYGHDLFVPVRELIMNGMDAVRARRRVENNTLDDAKVTFSLDKFTEGAKLVFEDEGVGMNADTFVRFLLGFGTSGWREDHSLEEEADTPLEEDDVSGQFGIGFFSVFMLGDKVRVISRRWDAGLNETQVLEFPKGLNARPVIYQAEGDDRLRHCGTRIEVILDSDDFEKTWLGQGEEVSIGQVLGSRIPSSDVLLEAITPGGVTMIDGRYWKDEDALTFLERVYPTVTSRYTEESIRRCVQPLLRKNGEIVGRGLLPQGLEYKGNKHFEYSALHRGMYISKGAGIGGGLAFLGLLCGVPERAGRDRASPEFGDMDLLGWIQTQLDFIDQTNKKGKKNSDEMINFYTQKTDLTRFQLDAPLNNKKFIHLGTKTVSIKDFILISKTKKEFWTLPTYDIEYLSQAVELKWIDDRVFQCSAYKFGIFTNSANRLENKNYNKLFYDSHMSDIEIAEIFLGINKDGWENIFSHSRNQKKHIATDVHGKEHFAAVVILYPNMTEEQFKTSNPEVAS